MKSLLSRRQCLISILRYLLVALAALLIAPWIGSESIDLRQVLADLTEKTVWTTDTQIFVHQRLPRVILAFLVGGSLAMAGSVFQVILRNPLATPYTLGITGGGTVGAYLAISLTGLSFQLGPFSSVQLMALVGSGVTLILIYLLAKRPQGITMSTLLLTGVTIGILCSAVILLIRYLVSPHLLVGMDRWMMGSLDVVGYSDLAGLFPFLLPGLGLLLLQTARLNHLSLGSDLAYSHGVNVTAVQRDVFIGGGLATASVVSLAGPIGFVGLIVPHTIRTLSGYDHRVIIPAAFLGGGAFLVACDTIARTIVAPTEMPVGIITAIVGGPFFIHLLLKKN